MKRICTIVFTDGESMQVEFEKQLDASVVARELDNLLDRNTIAFKIDGNLVVYPMVNIRSITLDPAPAGLPVSVIQGASVV